MSDPVNHPAHYSGYQTTVECIDITRHLSFRLGSAFKYVWRSGKKNPEKTVEDLKKALWYLEDIRLFPQEVDECQQGTARSIFDLIPESMFGLNTNKFYALLEIINGDFVEAGIFIERMIRDSEVTEDSAS